MAHIVIIAVILSLLVIRQLASWIIGAIFFSWFRALARVFWGGHQVAKWS